MKINSGKICFFFFCFGLFQFTVFAQNTDDLRRQERDFQRNEADLRQRERILRGGDIVSGRTPIESVVLSKEERARNAERAAEMEARSALINKMAAVPASHYNEYKVQLKNKKNGMFRIFSENGCYSGQIISTEELERCANVPPVKGGGSYYSFRLKTHNAFYTKDWWDIHFANDKFVVVGDAVQSIIADIGEINVEDVDLDSKAVKFLADYKPKNSIKEINEEFKVLEKGIESNGFTYSKKVEAKLGSTYAARFIAYDLKDEYKRMKPAGSEGKALDVTLVFKIVGIEKDKSLIVFWKELQTNLPRKKIGDD